MVRVAGWFFWKGRVKESYNKAGFGFGGHPRLVIKLLTNPTHYTTQLATPIGGSRKADYCLKSALKGICLMISVGISEEVGNGLGDDR